MKHQVLVAFLGCPSSLGAVARQVLQKGGAPRFLCVLEPGQSSESVCRAWNFSVQPLSEAIHLMVIHEPRGKAFEGIGEFCGTLCGSGAVDLDVLFVSDEASWGGSRRLAKDLQGLQTRLEKVSANCLVRRV